MVLKPAEMQRVAVIGLRDERQRILSILYDLGVVQIEPLSKSALEYLKSGTEDINMREVLEELLRIRSIKSALPPGPQEKTAFSSLGDLISVSKSINIDGEVNRLVKEQSRLLSKMDEISNRTELVRKLSYVKEDLSIFDLESATAFFGSLSRESYESLHKSLSSIENVMIYSAGKSQDKEGKKDFVNIIVVVPGAQLDKFGFAIQKTNVRLERIPKFKGTPDEVLSRLATEGQSIEQELKDIDSKLGKLSDRYYATISSVEEQLSIEAKKFEVTNSLGFTDNAFVLEGWVPQDRFNELEKVLHRDSTSTNLLRIRGEGEPPTLLENPKQLKFFESFIRFYSIPMEAELDPTLIFAFTFPIFFGLMLGDVGYGLAILGISYWIINRLNHPGGKTIVPKFLRSFAGRIFRPSQFKKLAMAMIPGAILGIIFGFIFNEYFGFKLNQYLFQYLNKTAHLGLPANGTFIDPISTAGLKSLLLFAGYIGLFEVSFGLVIGMLNGYWEHNRKHSIGKLGWLLVAWGISLFGLNLLHGGGLSPATNPILGVYIGVIVAGLGLIAFGEGTRALIELPSIISHILSYTRILGILLASVILAYVIDLIFEGDLSSGIGLAVVGIVILVFGQLFNLVLAMFEPGVQGARLIYVEFFSKFFHGSGRPFSPFRGGRTYTVSEIEMMDSRLSKSTMPNGVSPEIRPPTSEPIGAT
jgi:V/A-type H+/Na+-transporting ATPase subunit I